MASATELLPGLESEFIHTGGARLHVVTAGPQDGPLVILLHGFPEFWYGWRHQIAPLAAAGFRVLVPDQRGYNTSDKPRELSAYTLDCLCDDVVGLIQSQGRQRCNLVGHDWGAAVAWWLASRSPERLQRVAILNVPHPVVMRKQLRGNFAQLRKSWYMFFFQLPWLPEAMIGLRRYQNTLASLRKTSCPGSFSDQDLERYRQAWQQPGAMTTMINWYRAMLRRPPAKLASVRVRVPTLILWGVKDPFLGEELLEPSLALCDNGRAVRFPNATHWLQHDEAAQVSEHLIHFLQQDFGPPPAA
jgi:pimeloyl-ACP methyl ester carboxylesterase